MGTGADAERPVAVEPAPGPLVGAHRPHRPAEQDGTVPQRPHRERVDGLRPIGLGEPAEGIGLDLGVLDHRLPEAPDQPEGDFVLRPLAERQPAAALDRQLRQVAQPHPLGRPRRPFPVQQPDRDFRQRPSAPEHPDQRLAPAELDQVDLEQRRPDRPDLGAHPNGDRVRDVVPGKDSSSRGCVRGAAIAACSPRPSGAASGEDRSDSILGAVVLDRPPVAALQGVGYGRRAVQRLETDIAAVSCRRVSAVAVTATVAGAVLLVSPARRRRPASRASRAGSRSRPAAGSRRCGWAGTAEQPGSACPWESTLPTRRTDGGSSSSVTAGAS